MFVFQDAGSQFHTSFHWWRGLIYIAEWMQSNYYHGTGVEIISARGCDVSVHCKYLNILLQYNNSNITVYFHCALECNYIVFVML